ncbi:hypothetical protein [Yaniella sp.]|uniref:hypothetical protein n=1 Tax=Yaniella sp. TaxID=2773929 RepID=UPI002649610C|nr:hypothetical protein [Yaniella sp.]MDN6358633.1 ion transporter [Yaniella sp.]
MADDQQRLIDAEYLAQRLDRPMGVLGIIFLLVVLAQLLVTDPTGQVVLSVVSWVFWGVFVAEFLLRAYVARFQGNFWRKNWWQVIFLLVPFLRFFRVLRALRFLHVARFGRVLSAGVRGSRSAEKLLSNRVAWLLAVTAIVMLAASQLLYLFADYPSYFDALYEAALAQSSPAFSMSCLLFSLWWYSLHSPARSALTFWVAIQWRKKCLQLKVATPLPSRRICANDRGSKAGSDRLQNAIKPTVVATES